MSQSGSGFTNSNRHNSHSSSHGDDFFAQGGGLRKSFHGYPLSKPARNNPGFTPANSPVYPEKAAAHRQMEEPENLRPGRNSAKSPPPVPRNTKSFMAPTISAACKVLSPKKRVLSERNDASISGKTPPSKSLKPHFSGSENSIDRMDIDSFEPNNQEFHPSFDKPHYDLDSESLADLSNYPDPVFEPVPMSPYDPKTNNLVPRPRFLRYRPLDAEELYRLKEFKNGSTFFGKENQGMANSSSSKEAEKSPGRSLGERPAMVAVTNKKEENSKPRNLQNKDDTLNGEKSMSEEKLHGTSNMSLNEEKGQVVEEEDEEEEEEEEEEQQQGTWSFRKIFLLVFVLISASAVFMARNPGLLLENPAFDDVVTSNQSLVWSEMDGNHTEIQNGSEMTHQLEEGETHEDDVLSDFEDDIHDEMQGLNEQDIEWEAYGFTSEIGKSNDFEGDTEIGNPIEEEDDEIMAQIENSNDLEELVPDMGIDYAFPESVDDSNDPEELVAAKGIIDAFPESANEEQELLPYSEAEKVEERDTKVFTDAYAEPAAQENSEQDTIPTFSEKADNQELLAEELLKDVSVEEYGYELFSAAVDDVQVYDTEYEESSITDEKKEYGIEYEESSASAEKELLKDVSVEEYGYELLSAAADDVQVYDTEYEESSITDEKKEYGIEYEESSASAEITSKGNEIPAEKEIKNSRVLTWAVMAVVTVLAVAAVAIQRFRSKISSEFCSSSSSNRTYSRKTEFIASSVPGKKQQEKEEVLGEKQHESQETSGTMQGRVADDKNLCRSPPSVQLMTQYSLTDESRCRSRTRVSSNKRTANARSPFQTPRPAAAAAPEDSVPLPLGSYTTFENIPTKQVHIPTKQAEEEDAKLTPLRRSARINNKQATTAGKS